MTIEIELDGTRHQVMLRREGDRWIAGFAGRAVAVSVAEAGGRWSMLSGRKSYEISFESSANGELIVFVNGAAIPLTLIDPRQRGRRGSRSGSEARPRAIVAPMPGRIVKVLVKPRETVAAHQPLVVLEAMKMENELRAPRDGVVDQVRVTEGLLVEANAVLLVLR